MDRNLLFPIESSNPLSNLFVLILIGAMAGVIYLAYDSWSGSSQSDEQTTEDATPSGAVINDGDTETSVVEDAATNEVAAGTDRVNEITDSSIFIPSAGVLSPIVRIYLDGTSWDVDGLGMNVGHLEGTSWLDRGPGNIVLSAHVEMRDGRAGAFAFIGDLVILKQGNEERHYAVTEIRNVAPDDLSVVYPTTSERLTLITCDGYDFLQNAYTERTVVIAEPLSS